MGEWITTESDNVRDLANQADFALSEIEKLAKRGIVSRGIAQGSNNSYLYTDENGVLKFYNSITNTVQTVSLS